MPELFDLDGKTALVTGAGRGLGRAMAIGLARAGARVVVTDVIDFSETVEEIGRTGRGALGLNVDVSRKQDVQAMVSRVVNDFGSVDILVNNAGVYLSTPAEEMKEEEWDRVLGINLKGQFLCAQTAGREMIKRGSGKIINIASIAGKAAFALSAAYNASKAGIILLTKSLAVEWGRHNVQVNAICPGLFATPMTEGFIKDKDFLQTVKSKIPLSRYGEPEELVGTAVYLSSAASDYMTGHALVIDGGWTAGL